MPIGILCTGGHGMNEAIDRYKQVVNEEKLMFEKLSTCNTISDAIHRTIFKQADTLHILTVGEILNFIFEMETDIRMELMHQRLAKGVLARQIDMEQN